MHESCEIKKKWCNKNVRNLIAKKHIKTHKTRFNSNDKSQSNSIRRRTLTNRRVEHYSHNTTKIIFTWKFEKTLNFMMNQINNLIVIYLKSNQNVLWSFFHFLKFKNDWNFDSFWFHFRQIFSLFIIFENILNFEMCVVFFNQD